MLVHPFDTLITRIQSPEYKSIYKHPNGALRRSLFRGLYQGFGPTIITGVPSSVAFFAIYESAKSSFQANSKDGYLGKIPEPLAHAISSGVADLAACAIQNPSEVLKQNAQIVQSTQGASRQPLTLALARQFIKRPAKLWTGYTMMAASRIPGTSLSFSLYEYLKATWIKRSSIKADDIAGHIKISTLSAGLAGAGVSWLLVPIDVVKTRMRLAAGDRIGQTWPATKIGLQPATHRTNAQSPSPGSPIAVAKNILLKDGVRGLFRGATLTCIIASLGCGVFLGSYDGMKLYYKNSAVVEGL